MLKKRLLLASILFYAFVQAQEPLYDYVFFTNSRMTGNYFFSKINYTGSSFVKNEQQRLPVSTNIFHTPGNALELGYVNGQNGKWQVILGKKEIRGQDNFTKPVSLSFWIYAEGKTAGSSLPEVSIVKRRYAGGDTSYSKAISFPASSAKNWVEILIPVTRFELGEMREEEIVGIRFSQQSDDGVNNTLYLDDISFREFSNKKIPVTKPVISTAKGYAKHVDITWTPISDPTVKYVKVYRSIKGSAYQPIGIQDRYINRYTDYTGETGKEYQYKISFAGEGHAETSLSLPATSSTHPMTDDELLNMVQEACFRYYWEGAEKISGLAKENISGRHNMIATGASGFGIMALITGTERGFITRGQSVERFIRIVNFLDKAASFHGVFPHFLDGPSGKVETFFGKRDNGGDLVETSFLLQGLLTARAYFNRDDPKEKVIRDKITAIWERTEWSWYRRYADSKFLYWHWSPDQAWVINHRLIGWNETMVTYLLAIASPTHGIPAKMYYTGWANQDSTGQEYRSDWGGTTDGSMYTNGKSYYNIKLDVGVSNGGPLFFTHYSYLGYDPHLLTDAYTNYFTNNQHIAQINHRYCVENPGKYIGYGDSCWGLTASDGPYNYSADEPVLQQDKGKIGPTGAVSSFPYTPTESMKALKNYYYNYGKFLWGEYGFRDAFDLSQNWCSDIYMGLNQAPMTVMIENYRTGLIWKLLMSDSDIQAGLKKLAAERP